MNIRLQHPVSINKWVFKSSKIMNQNLVFDIGMHMGQDTAFYLKNGYHVVAVEANPLLVKENELKFRHAIKDKRLVILNRGISDKEGSMIFYVNKRLSEWSSFDKAIGTRNNTPYEEIEVSCLTTEQLFQEYGIPFYLKIDIEGHDHFCIDDIDPMGDKPVYVSCEATDIKLLELLKDKGYTRFKLIGQGNNFKPIDLKQESQWHFPKYRVITNGIKMRVQDILPFRYKYSSSGPFGEDSKGTWYGYEEIKQRYLAYYQFDKKQPLNTVSWFDFHAGL